MVSDLRPQDADVLRALTRLVGGANRWSLAEVIARTDHYRQPRYESVRTSLSRLRALGLADISSWDFPRMWVITDEGRAVLDA